MNEEFFTKPKDNEPWEVAIIGSGPSSLTAAIYTTRGAASTLVLAGDTWGGQLMLTSDVDNYPGFPEGIMGPELMEKMRKQAERFNAEIIDKNVTEINFDKSPFELKAGDQTYTAKSIIIGTGADTIWLGVEGEERLRGRGVSSCAPCDAPFFKDKNVIVVGGGDSAMEEAMYLTKYASQVTLIHRRDAFKASKAMQQKVFDSNIKIIWDTEVEELQGDQKIESVKLKTTLNTKQSENIEGNEVGRDENYIYWERPVEGLFVAIGHKPSTSIFRDKISLDVKGYIKKQNEDDFNMATSVKGVFVAGDVHDTHYKQAVTAAAFGCMAAMEVLKYLDKDAPSY